MDKQLQATQFLLYKGENGRIKVDVLVQDETVWLTQVQMAELFAKSRSTINEHIKNIYNEKELDELDTMKKFGNPDFSTKPTNFYNTDENFCITYGYGDTPFGEVLIGFTEKGVCYLGFVDNNKELIFESFKEFYEKSSLLQDDDKAREYLENIFIKNKRYKLVVKGTEFQVSVWNVLLNIPRGEVVSYQDIADSLKKPKAVRAVANAIGKNNIAYLIPCHRVIAKSGAMGGYRWGIERKKDLIAHESIDKKKGNE